MFIVPKPYPREFREDVVRVTRQGDAPLKQLAADFGIAESCLRNWIRKADVEDGVRPGISEAEPGDLREARKTDPAVGAGERGAAPRGGLSLAGQSAIGAIPKIVFPLVRELAADGIPVAVTCRCWGSPDERSTPGVRRRSVTATLTTPS
jgi:hypothetical protein